MFHFGQESLQVVITVSTVLKNLKVNGLTLWSHGIQDFPQIMLHMYVKVCNHKIIYIKNNKKYV